MVRAKAMLVNGQSAPIERFGFLQAVCHLEQLRQIVQVRGDFWIVGSEALLVNGQERR